MTPTFSVVYSNNAIAKRLNHEAKKINPALSVEPYAEDTYVLINNTTVLLQDGDQQLMQLNLDRLRIARNFISSSKK